MRTGVFISVLGAGLICAAPLLAQPAPTSSAPTTDKAAKSKECSAEADQKGLHGKARKRFRSACRHGKS
jgi:hypothetical protein